jgi:aldose 1-epimerase
LSGDGHFVPSGRQFRITHADQELVVAEVGGGIRTYQSGGEDVVDGYAESEMCSGGRGQLLCPWPNRVGNGRWSWLGVDYQLPLTEPEHSNAIHGLVRWLSWRAEQTSEGGDASSSLRLSCALVPQPGWPWRLDLAVGYTLSDRGLEVATSVTNAGGPGSCPIGIGWHPYIAAFGGVVDSLEIQVPANVSYVSDERGLPISSDLVDGTDDDFRSPRRIGPAKLDLAFTDLERDPDGRAVIEVRPASRGASYQAGRAVRLWMDERFTHLMIYTGDTLPELGRRRRGIAIEPMTCAPDMLRNLDGLLELPEGSSVEARWGLDLLKF